jgi:DNA-binding response OmpR family regulator
VQPSVDAVNESDLVYALRCRIEDLERALGSEWRAPAVLKLTGQQNRVLGLIVTKRFASTAIIADVLYGEDLDPPDDNVIRVLVHTMRRKLLRRGITIKTELGRGRTTNGYAIDPHNLKRLNALYVEGEQQLENDQ